LGCDPRNQENLQNSFHNPSIAFKTPRREKWPEKIFLVEKVTIAGFN